MIDARLKHQQQTHRHFRATTIVERHPLINTCLTGRKTATRLIFIGVSNLGFIALQRHINEMRSACTRNTYGVAAHANDAAGRVIPLHTVNHGKIWL
jgi:hypothetical protein